MMALRALIARFSIQEDLNFLLTNRIPRRLLTRFIGWLSKLEHPLICKPSIAVWRLFADLDLSDAEKTTFRSLHDCFTRALRAGARPIDPEPSLLTSPSDGIVGSCGAIAGTELFQIKGFPYELHELLDDPALVERYRDGLYVTLRLTSSMYHRFHAPADCVVDQVTYIAGDTWNVNPIALKRIEKLFCKNERAVVRTRLPSGDVVTLVPVAAILVASIRLHFLDTVLSSDHRGPKVFRCEAHFRKGEEMGWFEHGSTIIVFARRGFALAEGIVPGAEIRMGQALIRRPEPASH